MIPNHVRPLGPDHCPLCLAYHTDERYRARVDGRPLPSAAIAAVAPTCRHLGDQVPASAALLAGLSTARFTYVCLAGLGRVPGLAQPCCDCGPKCYGYVAAVGDQADDDQADD